MFSAACGYGLSAMNPMRRFGGSAGGVRRGCSFVTDSLHDFLTSSSWLVSWMNLPSSSIFSPTGSERCLSRHCGKPRLRVVISRLMGLRSISGC